MILLKYDLNTFKLTVSLMSQNSFTLSMKNCMKNAMISLNSYLESLFIDSKKSTISFSKEIISLGFTKNLVNVSSNKYNDFE